MHILQEFYRDLDTIEEGKKIKTFTLIGLFIAGIVSLDVCHDIIIQWNTNPLLMTEQGNIIFRIKLAYLIYIIAVVMTIGIIGFFFYEFTHR